MRDNIEKINGVNQSLGELDRGMCTQISIGKLENMIRKLKKNNYSRIKNVKKHEK